MDSRRFVIPDIHGCARTFRTLVENVIQLTQADFLYLLGDYIDRGPDSGELLDYIRALVGEGYRVNALRGNHEQMLLNARNSEADLELWLMNGGQATLDSFGIDSPADVPSRYLRFFGKLHYFISLEDFVLVHACLNFDNPDPFADREAMLWSRSCEPDLSRIGNRRVVCGHTPVTMQSIMSGLDGPKIMIDNGCVYKGRPGMGTLTALELDSMNVFCQQNID